MVIFHRYVGHYQIVSNDKPMKFYEITVLNGFSSPFLDATHDMAMAQNRVPLVNTIDVGNTIINHGLGGCPYFDP